VWHTTLTEFIWTMLGAIGIVLGQGNLRESQRDLDAVRLSKSDLNGRFEIMRIIAYGHYRNDLFRLCKHITVFAVGLLACLLPPALANQTITATGLVVTGGLFTIVMLTILGSVLDRRQRDAIEEIEIVRTEARNGGHEHD
jgi:hypothetical protein